MRPTREHADRERSRDRASNNALPQSAANAVPKSSSRYASEAEQAGQLEHGRGAWLAG